VTGILNGRKRIGWVWVVLLGVFPLGLPAFAVAVELEDLLDGVVDEGGVGVEGGVELDFNKHVLDVCMERRVLLAMLMTCSFFKLIFCSYLLSATARILLRFCDLNSFTFRYLCSFLCEPTKALILRRALRRVE
jgi:hypothetical protein